MTEPTDEQATRPTGWLQALHEQQDAMAELVDLPWRIRGGTATADLDELGSIRMEGTKLVVTPAPDPLPIVNQLRAAGWRRLTLPTSIPAWVIAAEWRSAEGKPLLQVRGSTFTLPDGTEWCHAAPHSTMDYFSPPPPVMRGRGWHARSAEWNRRLLSGDWEGWTATPFIEGTQ